MKLNLKDPDLVHWLAVPDRKQALEFTAQGWAIAEACTSLGEYENPQALIVRMLGQIISGFVDESVKKVGPDLAVEWQMSKDRLTATIAFEIEALNELSGICDMELSELQSAIQSSLELSLLKIYNQHKDKQQLH
jgi:hypothetical protein